MNEAYQRFFTFMEQTHGLILLTAQMDDIINEAVKVNEQIQLQEEQERRKEMKRRERLDPYGRFDGIDIPEWAEECCYNCAVPLYDEPGLPTKDGDAWYCEDCEADYALTINQK